MPTEVLVMCTRCGRPQPARPGNCVACGELLPDAPLPAASEAPFLRLEGTGGRLVSGVDRKLTYQAGASAAPAVVELDTLRGAVLVRRSLGWPLLLVMVAIGLAFAVPSLRLVAYGLAGLGVLGAILWRRYAVALRMLDGGRLSWQLGWIFLGSTRLHALEKSWTAGAQALASRGVIVQDAQRGPGSGA